MVLEGEGTRAARNGDLKQWVSAGSAGEKTDELMAGGRQVRQPWQVYSFLPM